MNPHPLPLTAAGGGGAAHRWRGRHRGRPVQVDPIKPTLKAPGTKRLKVRYEEPLSKFALKFNLRLYIVAASGTARGTACQCVLSRHRMPFHSRNEGSKRVA
jgi:hypothetical protein